MTDRIRLNEGNRRWWTLAAMCFALFMIMLDNTVVNVALPSIQDDLGVSLSGLEWTVNIYTLTFAVLLVTGGRLGDIFGRRRMFLFGVVVFALSSAAIGLAPSEGWLVAGRALQGVGRGVHDARDAVDHHRHVPARGARQGDRHLGRAYPRSRWRSARWWAARWPSTSPGGRSSSSTSRSPSAPWRSRCSRPTSRATRPRSTRSTGPASPRCRSGLTRARARPRRGQRLGLGLGRRSSRCSPSAVAGLGTFALIEPRVREPMVEFSLFRSRTFLGANLVAFIVSFAMFAMFFFTALYLQNILGYSAVEAGVRFLPSTLMIVLIAPLAGRLSDRVGPRPLMVSGLTLRRVRAVPPDAHHRRHRLRAAAARVRPDGHRHGAGDVADVDRGDELGGAREGGRGLGHPLDEPDGRRHLRRRGDRRAVPAPGAQRARRQAGRHRRQRRGSESSSSTASAPAARASRCRRRSSPRRTTPSSTPSRTACGCRPAWRRSERCSPSG